LIILSGGGLAKDQVAQGLVRVRRMLARTVSEYLERTAACGLDRKTRTQLTRLLVTDNG
jgi:hypothetical protein